MNHNDLSLFNQAVAQVQNEQGSSTYTTFTDLYRTYPEDPNLLLWLAYTAPTLTLAQTWVDQLARLNPTDPNLPAARDWLSRQLETAASKTQTAWPSLNPDSTEEITEFQSENHTLLYKLPDTARKVFSEHLSRNEKVVWATRVGNEAREMGPFGYFDIAFSTLVAISFTVGILTVFVGGFLEKAGISLWQTLAVVSALFGALAIMRGGLFGKRNTLKAYALTDRRRLLSWRGESEQIEVYKEVTKTWSGTSSNSESVGFQGWPVFPFRPDMGKPLSIRISGLPPNTLPPDPENLLPSFPEDRTPHTRLYLLPDHVRKALAEHLKPEDEVIWVARPYQGGSSIPFLAKLFLYGFGLIWCTGFFGGFSSFFLELFFSVPEFVPFLTVATLFNLIIIWFWVQGKIKRASPEANSAYALTSNKKALLWNGVTGQVEVYGNLVKKGRVYLPGRVTINLAGRQLFPPGKNNTNTSFKLTGLQGNLPEFLGGKKHSLTESTNQNHAPSRVPLDIPTNNGLDQLLPELSEALIRRLYVGEKLYMVRADTRNQRLKYNFWAGFSLLVYLLLIFVIPQLQGSKRNPLYLVPVGSNGYWIILLIATSVLCQVLYSLFKGYVRHKNDLFAITERRVMVGNPFKAKWLVEYGAERILLDKLEIILKSDSKSVIYLMEETKDSDGDVMKVRRCLYYGQEAEWVFELLNSIFGNNDSIQ